MSGIWMFSGSCIPPAFEKAFNGLAFLEHCRGWGLGFGFVPCRVYGSLFFVVHSRFGYGGCGLGS